MDFGSVLYSAQRNKESSKQAVNYYKTSFDPPKKEQREKKLSLNIQKFLARQEEEKRHKLEEDERKKQELFALRNKDKKSNKRIQSMLKRTKSANKSVLEDAVDNVNTAITAAGPLQPDEDDYGYVSKDASELYDRLVNRYAHQTSQEEPKFPQSSTKSNVDISSTKDRVKAALQREEEEKLLPRKRKRKSKTEGGAEDEKQSDDEASTEPVKSEKSSPSDDSGQPKKDKFRIPKKNAGPPPIDFQSLLKLAEQKQHEPIVIEKKVEARPDRPMTEKEKQEYLREKVREKARAIRRESPAAAAKLMEALKKKHEGQSKERPPKTANKASAATVPSTSATAKDTPSKGPRPQSDLRDSRGAADPTSRPKSDVKAVSSSFEKPKSSDKTDSSSAKQLPTHLKSRELPPPAARPKAVAGESKSLPRSNETFSKEQKQKLLSKPTTSASVKVTKSSIENDARSTKVPDKSRDEPSSAAKKFESSRPPKGETSVRQFPPPDVRRNEPKKELSSKPQGFKQFPPPDMAPKKNKPPVMKKRHVFESDDEYDSEMDDFIDDSDANFDFSKHISQIFGYDRSKYSKYDEEEDDDECMESNFSQLQKEEYISTKYGILEDLADIRKTKQDKERKKKRVK